MSLLVLFFLIPSFRRHPYLPLLSFVYVWCLVVLLSYVSLAHARLTRHAGSLIGLMLFGTRFPAAFVLTYTYPIQLPLCLTVTPLLFTLYPRVTIPSTSTHAAKKMLLQSSSHSTSIHTTLPQPSLPRLSHRSRVGFLFQHGPNNPPSTGFMPFMEYAGSYALYNYKLVDPAKGMDYDNIRLIRAFEHGLDHTSSEAGFVLVHIDMVKNSGPLVSGTVEALQAAHSNRAELNAAMAKQLGALRRINATMETMWMKSKPRDYTTFRTFIFGITSQSMFPEGVVYEGINDGKPMSFRGESGANDSMIPLMDNFLQIPMPDTPLTEILKDFRKYRPSNHRAFLEHVRDRSVELDLREFALRLRAGAGEAEDDEAVWESRRLWLQLLDQVREFRWRHWCFGKEYILKMTDHPTATGGSPIVTWLPNQLKAVLNDMVNIAATVGEEKLGSEVQAIMDLVRRQEETLRKEVEKYCEERGVARS